MDKYAELYFAIGDWAMRHGHKNVKERVKPGELYTMEHDGVLVNANPSSDTVGHVPPWAFVVERYGLPVAVVQSRGGEVVGNCEDELIRLFRGEAA